MKKKPTETKATKNTDLPAYCGGSHSFELFTDKNLTPKLFCGNCGKVLNL